MAGTVSFPNHVSPTNSEQDKPGTAPGAQCGPAGAAAILAASLTETMHLGPTATLPKNRFVLKEASIGTNYPHLVPFSPYLYAAFDLFLQDGSNFFFNLRELTVNTDDKENKTVEIPADWKVRGLIENRIVNLDCTFNHLQNEITKDGQQYFGPSTKIDPQYLANVSLDEFCTLPCLRGARWLIEETIKALKSEWPNETITTIANLGAGSLQDRKIIKFYLPEAKVHSSDEIGLNEKFSPLLVDGDSYQTITVDKHALTTDQVIMIRNCDIANQPESWEKAFANIQKNTNWKVFVISCSSTPSFEKRILPKLKAAGLLNEAEYIIAHNGLNPQAKIVTFNYTGESSNPNKDLINGTCTIGNDAYRLTILRKQNPLKNTATALRHGENRIMTSGGTQAGPSGGGATLNRKPTGVSSGLKRGFFGQPQITTRKP